MAELKSYANTQSIGLEVFLVPEFDLNQTLLNRNTGYKFYFEEETERQLVLSPLTSLLLVLKIAMARLETLANAELLFGRESWPLKTEEIRNVGSWLPSLWAPN